MRAPSDSDIKPTSEGPRLGGPPSPPLGERPMTGTPLPPPEPNENPLAPWLRALLQALSGLPV
jgi:hypothetical protein